MMTWRTTTSKQQLASTNIVRTFGSILIPLDSEATATRMAANFNLGRPQATTEINWQPADLATFTAAVLDVRGSHPALL